MPATIYQEVHGDVRPLPDDILAINMEQGEKFSKHGLIILDDNGKDNGVRPRWCQVYRVGENVTFVEPGEWILVDHGRWTFGINLYKDGAKEGDKPLYLQKIDPTGIMLASKEKPEL